MQATSLELDVLILASRRTIEPEDADRLRELLVQSVDWEIFTRLCLAHRVTVVAFRTLNRIAPDLMPEDITEASRLFESRQGERNAVLFNELIRIVDTLGRHGIAVLPFKGPVLSYIAYGDLTSRELADLDFLIHDEDIFPCLDLLSHMGYPSHVDLPQARQKACLKYYGQTILYRNDGKVAIEPHWAIAPATFGLSTNLEGTWQRSTHVECAGRNIPSLSPEDLLTVLCIHGSKHQWTRLQWVCDLGEVLRAYPGMDWDNMLRRAREQRCLRMILIGLRLAELFTGYLLPPQVSACIETDKTVLDLSQKTSQLLFASSRPAPPFSRITRYRLRMRDHWTERFSYVWRTLVLPAESHLNLIDLPDTLIFAYYPIKIVHDYILLPAWLVLKKLRLIRNNRSVSH
jgi:hypothetical protein